MLKRAVFKQKSGADSAEPLVVEERLQQFLQPTMLFRHDVGIQHHNGRTRCNARTRIAGAGITAIAVHDDKAKRQVMQYMQAAQHMLGIVVYFRRIEDENEFCSGNDPGIGCQ